MKSQKKKRKIPEMSRDLPRMKILQLRKHPTADQIAQPPSEPKGKDLTIKEAKPARMPKPVPHEARLEKRFFIL